MKELKILIEKTIQGDATAFTEVVRRFQDMAVGYAYSILGDFHLAQDTAQEAFIDAFYLMNQLRDPERFPNWFRTIIFKHCNRLVRGKQVEIASIETAIEMPSNAKEPSEEIVEQELKGIISSAIVALPDPQRQVVTLFYISGYATHEIAAFLGASCTTIRKRLQRARTQLKKGMIPMIQDHLQENRPSKDERFIKSMTFLEKPYVEGDMRWEGETWELHDPHHNLVFWFHTEQEAQQALAFARQYVQRHGDINFCAFPNSLDDPLDENHYNYARSSARGNNKAAAIEFLQKAIALDRSWVEHAKTNSDFDNIRSSPEFQQLINLVE